MSLPMRALSSVKGPGFAEFRELWRWKVKLHNFFKRTWLPELFNQAFSWILGIRVSTFRRKSNDPFKDKNLNWIYTRFCGIHSGWAKEMHNAKREITHFTILLQEIFLHSNCNTVTMKHTRKNDDVELRNRTWESRQETENEAQVISILPIHISLTAQFKTVADC